MLKFGRNYRLYLQTVQGDTIQVGLPFTIEFDITRNTLTSANVCQIRVYNLSQKNRNLIRHNANDFGHYTAVSLEAGYGDNLAVIFRGNVTQAWSVREGTDYISQIECFDGGYAAVNGHTSLQISQGTPNRNIITTLISTLPHVTVGVVGNYPGISKRGTSYSGNTFDILRDLTGGGFFVDGGKGNALNTNEYIALPGSITLVNSQSGLLGTPVLEQKGLVHFDMIFEPSLVVGGLVKLMTLTEANFNGLYKVTAVKHRGMISESVCGSAITTAEFFYDTQLIGAT